MMENPIFLKSSDIKVYPTNYREQAAGDANSGLMTERNLTYLKRLSIHKKLNSYFTCTITQVNDENIFNFDLTLDGYRFIFSLDSDFLGDFDEASDIYAYIKTAEINIVGNTGKTDVLIPQDKSTISMLDVSETVGEDAVYYFKGLAFIDSMNDNTEYTYMQLLHKGSNGWEVVDHKDLKISTNEIANEVSKHTVTGDYIKNINEQFNTENIDISSTATINYATITDLYVSSTATINNANITYATITNAEVTSTATINKAVITNVNITSTATINNANITTATIGTIAATVHILGANIDSESVTSSTIGNASITTATIANASISQATINNGSLTGTLTVTGDIKKDSETKIIPKYTGKADYSVLAVVGNSLTWVAQFDGSYTYTQS